MDDRIATIERMYELFDAGDIDGVMELCVPDPVVTQDPALPWGGRYVGRDAVIEFAVKLRGGHRFEAHPRAVVRGGRTRHPAGPNGWHGPNQSARRSTSLNVTSGRSVKD